MSFQTNISSKTVENDFFRQVVFTGTKSQLVVMSLNAGEDIGEEVHEHVEQYLFNYSGQGKAVLDGVESDFNPGDVVIVSPG
ncbi:cupin domain-containing protein, partial [Candidatus Dojkabacteria bacterium]|nr:cupin domain-containing protein [Candidatus Dojkabacteria bacterium]